MTIQRQPSLRRLDWHYMAMQIGFWAMFASIVGYQTALLLDRGFSNGEAGLMTSVRCLAGIVCQPLLGGFADRHPEFPEPPSPTCALMTPSTLTIVEPSTLTPPNTSVDAFGRV